MIITIKGGYFYAPVFWVFGLKGGTSEACRSFKDWEGQKKTKQLCARSEATLIMPVVKKKIGKKKRIPALPLLQSRWNSDLIYLDRGCSSDVCQEMASGCCCSLWACKSAQSPSVRHSPGNRRRIPPNTPLHNYLRRKRLWAVLPLCFPSPADQPSERPR